MKYTSFNRKGKFFELTKIAAKGWLDAECEKVTNAIYTFSCDAVRRGEKRLEPD